MAMMPTPQQQRQQMSMKKMKDDKCVSNTPAMLTGTKESLSHKSIFSVIKPWHTSSGNAHM